MAEKDSTQGSESNILLCFVVDYSSFYDVNEVEERE